MYRKEFHVRKVAAMHIGTYRKTITLHTQRKIVYRINAESVFLNCRV